MRHAVHYLRKLLSSPEAGVRTDRQLLDRFAHSRDEAAFAELVQRHAPLVLDVGRRVLHCPEDAEDVFQATFLVLARKAGSLPWRDSVAGWLYQVAHRLALKARADRRRRDARERPALDEEAACAQADPAWRELCAALDEELRRLPEKLRAPILLCCLEGRSRDEAAQQLGWSVGQVKAGLERGRALLRARLLRRGFTLSAALLAAKLTPSVAGAQEPLVLLTIRAAVGFAMTGAGAVGISTRAVQLAEGGLRAMMLTKIKTTVMGLLAVVVLGTGGGLLAFQGGSESGDLPQKKEHAELEELRKQVQDLRNANEVSQREVKELRARLQKLESRNAEPSRKEGVQLQLRPGDRALRLSFPKQWGVFCQIEDEVDVVAMKYQGAAISTNLRIEGLVQSRLQVLATQVRENSVEITLRTTFDQVERILTAQMRAELRLLVSRRPGDPRFAQPKPDQRLVTFYRGAALSGLFARGDHLDVLDLGGYTGTGPGIKLLMDNLEILDVQDGFLTLVVTQSQAETLLVKEAVLTRDALTGCYFLRRGSSLEKDAKDQ